MLETKTKEKNINLKGITSTEETVNHITDNIVILDNKVLGLFEHILFHENTKEYTEVEFKKRLTDFINLYEKPNK